MAESARDEPVEAREWDSEKRSSPYSTVHDPYGDEDYCEQCDGPVTYSGDDDTVGSCGCD